MNPIGGGHFFREMALKRPESNGKYTINDWYQEKQSKVISVGIKAFAQGVVISFVTRILNQTRGQSRKNTIEIELI